MQLTLPRDLGAIKGVIKRLNERGSEGARGREGERESEKATAHRKLHAHTCIYNARARARARTHTQAAAATADDSGSVCPTSCHIQVCLCMVCL